MNCKSCLLGLVLLLSCCKTEIKNTNYSGDCLKALERTRRYMFKFNESFNTEAQYLDSALVLIDQGIDCENQSNFIKTKIAILILREDFISALDLVDSVDSILVKWEKYSIRGQIFEELGKYDSSKNNFSRASIELGDISKMDIDNIEKIASKIYAVKHSEGDEAAMSLIRSLKHLYPDRADYLNGFVSIVETPLKIKN